jgi:hypothetical protein
MSGLWWRAWLLLCNWVQNKEERENVEQEIVGRWCLWLSWAFLPPSSILQPPSFLLSGVCDCHEHKERGIVLSTYHHRIFLFYRLLVPVIITKILSSPLPTVRMKSKKQMEQRNSVTPWGLKKAPAEYGWNVNGREKAHAPGTRDPHPGRGM